ncbi:MAG: TMEM175 family protein [bacterium]
MSEPNANSRLEAFSDGVFAIAMTLLIIDIKIPSSDHITSTAEFWAVFVRIVPSIIAFVLSFTIILITWVNHHVTLKLVNKSSVPFMYANGLLLFSVVFLPFPTGLIGEFILTDYSSPAVILYEATLTLQAISWILLTTTALNNNLSKNELAVSQLKKNRKFGYYATVLYTSCGVAAIFVPFPIAIITLIIWIFWLVFGLGIKEE